MKGRYCGSLHMSETRQKFVSYRSEADQFRVRFVGGPLDGATIRTDVFPDCELFPHRVADREYLYRYRQISPNTFEARLERYGIPERPVEDPGVPRWQYLLATVVILVGLALVCWQAG